MPCTETISNCILIINIDYGFNSQLVKKQYIPLNFDSLRILFKILINKKNA